VAILQPNVLRAVDGEIIIINEGFTWHEFHVPFSCPAINLLLLLHGRAGGQRSGATTMNDTEQAYEDVFSSTVSDEALEAAGGNGLSSLLTCAGSLCGRCYAEGGAE
jgi:hypothetical protein